MTGTAPQNLRSVWIAKAHELDGQDYFAQYSSKQRAEVRRKGYLGKWSPDEVIRLAKREVELGLEVRKPRFTDQLRNHFGLVGSEIREALLVLLDEVPVESYKPPKELHEPPGYPFIFHSKRLRSDIYLKVQVAGTDKKPRALLWSCHPPDYQGSE